MRSMPETTIAFSIDVLIEVDVVVKVTPREGFVDSYELLLKAANLR